MGVLQLVPQGEAFDALANEYNNMLSDGMLLDSDERFDDLLTRCAEVEVKASYR